MQLIGTAVAASSPGIHSRTYSASRSACLSVRNGRASGSTSSPTRWNPTFTPSPGVGMPYTFAGQVPGVTKWLNDGHASAGSRGAKCAGLSSVIVSGGSGMLPPSRRAGPGAGGDDDGVGAHGSPWPCAP